MKKTLGITLAIVLLVSLVTLTACGSNSSKLVGRWTIADGREFSYLEFFSDGTYTSNKVNYEGNYSIDGDRLKLSGILVEAKTYTFEIKGNELSLYGENGSVAAVFEKES